MLLRAFRALMPKEERFIQHFIDLAQCLVEASTALEAVMTASAADRPERIKALSDIESRADGIAGEASRALHRAFITPFDRSDILALVNALDDAIDLMDEVPGHVGLYGIAEFDAPARAFAEQICRISRRLAEMMPLVGDIARNADRILHLCHQVSDVETEADAVLKQALQALIAEAPPMISFLGRRELYELLEAVTDRCDDVADLVEGIILDQV
jgi:uncharacterized protein Yka (UPF0111/DUF47 family)